MRRSYIVFGVVVLVIAGAAFGLWQFYFSAQLQRYRDDITRRDQLKTARDHLRDLFGTGKPETMISKMAEKVEPWDQAVARRGQYFSTTRFINLEKVPENTLLRAFYSQQFQKEIQRIQTDAYNKGVSLSSVDLAFGQPLPETLSGRAVNGYQVAVWLSQVQLGHSILRVLLDASPMRIDAVDMWDARPDKEVLQVRAFGV